MLNTTCISKPRFLSSLGSSDETPTEVFNPISDRIAIGVEHIFKGSISMYFPEYFKGWIGVGYDQGPSQLINIICSHTSCTQLSFNSAQIKSVKYFIGYLKEKGFRGILCSSSQSKCGFELEANIRKASTLLGLPVVCIEDFPGNYREIDGSNTSLLIVEGDFSRNIYINRYEQPPSIISCPAIRYDNLRIQQSEFKRVQKDRGSLDFILWAGQPEFDSNFFTLQVLLPELEKLSVTLLFKAHPGDMDYLKGGYADFFREARLRWIDVTNSSLNFNLFQQIGLVITQFSSVAIEAGFYGIPSLNILLKNAGEKLLLERTGSLTTNTICNGASFSIREQEGLLDYLIMCLTDFNAREKVLLNFDRIYDTHQIQLPKLLKQIRDIIPTVITK